MNMFPRDQALLNKSKVPLGLVIAPFRTQTDEDVCGFLSRFL